MKKKAFYVGDPVPNFSCPSSNNPRFYFNSAAGRYLVLSFFGCAQHESGKAVLEAITGELRSYFDDKKISFFGVTTDPQDEKNLKGMSPGIRYFWDFDGKVTDSYYAREHPFTLVLDPLLRVVGNIPLTDPVYHNKMLKNLLEHLPPLDLHAGVPVVAPVLVLPRIFETKFCKELVRLYETNGGKESGFMREQDGNTVAVIDYGFKRRKDFSFEVDPQYEELRAQVRTRLAQRLLPEIKKVFQFHVTRIERYTVACYEGEHGGFFNAHRDNTTKGTAHRRFACTINLNAEEFEGGELRFPEFGTRTYRAPTGGAVIFSCSLLHEATPVTQGKRYAFLPFFYDEEAAKIREENRKYLSGEVIDQRGTA